VCAHRGSTFDGPFCQDVGREPRLLGGQRPELAGLPVLEVDALEDGRRILVGRVGFALFHEAGMVRGDGFALVQGSAACQLDLFTPCLVR